MQFLTRIAGLYDRLAELTPSPVVRLNRAVVSEPFARRATRSVVLHGSLLARGRDGLTGIIGIC